MKTQTTFFPRTVLTVLLGINSGLAMAQQVSVLNPAKHPESPDAQSVYPDEILPLDTNLSWTKRFNGDETFNENEVLERVLAPTSMLTKASSNISTESNQSMKMDGAGVIKQLKLEQGKIKIQHGPIDRLGMPAMTMVFRVDGVEQLSHLQKGQEVGFSVDNSSGGFVITRIMPMDNQSMNESVDNAAGTSGSLDAQGIIKTIKVEQGKIKIKHGPIDRLGMPSMTMVFKVEDPDLFDGLKKGSNVSFSVDNTAGGFVITDIEPAE